MRSFKVFYDDLTVAAQKSLCKKWRTTPEAENWEDIPLVVLEREEKLNDPLDLKEIQESLNLHLSEIKREKEREEDK